MHSEEIFNALKKEDSVLSALLNDIFDGVYIVDKNRRIIFWNKGSEEITGYPAAQVMGRFCRDDILNHLDQNGTLLCRDLCPLTKTLKTGEHIRAKVYPLHKSGRRFPVETHIAPVRDSAGTIIGAVEVFRDISKEEEFRILQEKFNALIRKFVSSATMDTVMEQLQGSAESNARMRDLTVLYLDVVGFTGFAEKHSPEQVAKMLNDLFGICEVITRECHGDIDKFIGDAVMAVFIDANDAVAAGSKILSALSSLNMKRRQDGAEEIAVRIGVNSGMVVQGEIGTSERKDVTVIGDVVNTASRIESATPPQSFCISEATLSRLKDPGLFAFEKSVTVKNKKDPVSIFKYIGTGSIHSGTQ